MRMAKGRVQSPQARRAIQRLIFGTIAVYCGLCLLLIAVCENWIEEFVTLPRFWHINRTVWIGLGLGLVPFGVWLQSLESEREKRWRPSRLGRRFERLRVYSREGCHLCDDAIELLNQPDYTPYLPDLEEVDIDTDPELRRRFGSMVPVIEFDGKIRFKGKIDPILLRRLIEGTFPLTLECQRPR